MIITRQPCWQKRSRWGSSLSLAEIWRSCEGGLAWRPRACRGCSTLAVHPSPELTRQVPDVHGLPVYRRILKNTEMRKRVFNRECVSDELRAARIIGSAVRVAGGSLTQQLLGVSPSGLGGSGWSGPPSRHVSVPVGVVGRSALSQQEAHKHQKVLIRCVAIVSPNLVDHPLGPL